MDIFENYLNSIRKEKSIHNKVKVNIDEALPYLWKIGKVHCEEFKIHPHLINLYKQLIYYFTRNEDFEGNLNKGLYLVGKVGRGKSLAMTIMKNFTEIINKTMNYRLVDTEDFIMDYSKLGYDAVLKYRKGNLCIDDLGGEKNSTINYYGKSHIPVALLIKLRYRLFEEYGIITHATGNWPLKDETGKDNDLKKIYGVREISRCAKMFNIIEFVGEKDLRYP